MSDDQRGNRRERDSSPRNGEEASGEDNSNDGLKKTAKNLVLVTIIYFVQAFLTTAAILAVLIGIKMLPLCYVTIGLSLTQLVFMAIGNLEHCRFRDSTTFLGFILMLVTVACAFSTVKLLGQPETTAETMLDANLNDPFIQLIQISPSSGTLSETSAFIIGLSATLISGLCFSLSSSLKKSNLIPSGSPELQTFAVLTVSCLLAALVFVLTRLYSVQDQ